MEEVECIFKDIAPHSLELSCTFGFSYLICDDKRLRGLVRSRQLNGKGRKMMMKNFNRVLSLLFALTVFLSSLVLVSCTKNQQTSSTPPSPSNSQNSSVGSVSDEYLYHITFLVVDAEGQTQSFDIDTNEKYLRGALESQNLIKGEESQYGLMVTEVNGIRADYTLDNAYWALYVGEEYAMTGVDSTELADGAVYKFVYTKG